MPTSHGFITDDRRISEVLAEFCAALPGGRVTLGDAMAALGDRTIGGILLVLSLPTVMPVPLGVSVLFNLPVLLFTFQMMRGGDHVDLPGWLLGRSMSSEAAARLIGSVLPRLRWIEGLLEPRLPKLTAGGFERWLGTICFVMAVIAITPIPLIGWLPGFGLIVIALGLIEHDGLAVAVGLGFAVASALFATGLIASLAYAGTLIHKLPFSLP
ncbi:MAG: exopolysaccharide biosynthesis protein [Rhodospirillaceae bacterium]